MYNIQQCTTVSDIFVEKYYNYCEKNEKLCLVRWDTENIIPLLNISLTTHTWKWETVSVLLALITSSSGSEWWMRESINRIIIVLLHGSNLNCRLCNLYSFSCTFIIHVSVILYLQAYAYTHMSYGMQETTTNWAQMSYRTQRPLGSDGSDGSDRIKLKTSWHQRTVGLTQWISQ